MSHGVSIGESADRKPDRRPKRTRPTREEAKARIRAAAEYLKALAEQRETTRSPPS